MGVDAGASSADDHDFGTAAKNGAVGFAGRQVSSGFAMRDRVVGATKIVVNGNMAGWHVGQILEQPQRRQLRHAFGSPTIVVEVALRTAAAIDARAEFLGHGEHVVGTEHAAGAVGIVLAIADNQTGIGQCQLRGGDAHLAFTAHDFQAFADGLLLFFFEWAEVLDVAGELASLAGDVSGKNVDGTASNLPTPLRPEISASQSASLVLPTGLMRPIPVMTTRRAEAGMISERLAMNNQQFVSGRQSFGLKDLAPKKSAEIGSINISCPVYRGNRQMGLL